MAAKRRGDVKPAGQIRQSQIVTTFGPGAMVDLPDYAVIIGGLGHWNGYQERPITEERLAAKVKRCSARRHPLLCAAAGQGRSDGADHRHHRLAVSRVVRGAVRGARRRRPVAAARSSDRSRQGDEVPPRPEKPVKVVPIRFVQACPRGHVSDIDWKLFVHGKDDPCSRQLWIDERGTSGDLTDIFIRCECGKSKALSAATKLNDVPLGFCKGLARGSATMRRSGAAGGTGACQQAAGPGGVERVFRADAVSDLHSRADARAGCGDRGLGGLPAVRRVARRPCQGPQEAEGERGARGVVQREVWQEVQRRKGGLSAPTTASAKRDQDAAVVPEAVGEDQPDGVFFARTVAVPSREPALTRKISRVVKVHRLREVIAQVGFTRFEAAVPDVNGELALDVERASLSRTRTGCRRSRTAVKASSSG